VTGFDIAAILVVIAAASGYINHRFLRLPATSGTLVVALASSLIVVAADAWLPAFRLRESLNAFLSSIDFNETLMRGMLAFLLFAGALHLDLDGLLEHKWTIAALATAGVVLSTAIVAGLTWWVFQRVGVDIAFDVCLAFGALISPTDPIAVMGLLKEMRAPRYLESLIAGESLFNDGIAVAVFFGIVAIAGLSRADAGGLAGGFIGPVIFFVREIGGGIALGLLLGYVTYRALKSIDDHPLELLITLALAMFVYSVSFRLHVSGPIAVVIAGLLIGNPGRRLAMSAATRERVDAFWSMVDGILNAVLFLLLGLQVFTVSGGPMTFARALLVIPIVLLARAVSVAVPLRVVCLRRGLTRGMIPIVTWSGLRGGLSVAMMLSLPPFPERDLLLASTYAVVVFSILVQGLTVRRLLERYRLAAGSG
jgi:CPA1 family monovalent cation:H+ antiporter